MSDKQKPSKIAGAGAGIRKLVEGGHPHKGIDHGKTQLRVVPAANPTTKKDKAAVKAFVKLTNRLDPKSVQLPDVPGTTPGKVLDEMMGMKGPEPKSQSTVITTCTRKFAIDAAHRVLGDDKSPCRHLHGHRYVISVTVEAEVNAMGMVIDFAVLKTKVGKWLLDTYDHGLIVGADDPLLAVARATMVRAVVAGNKRLNQPTAVSNYDGGELVGKFHVLPGNPTAENIALDVMYNAIHLLMSDGMKVVEVTVEETENCSATVRPRDASETEEEGDEDGELSEDADEPGQPDPDGSDADGGGDEDDDGEADDGDAGDEDEDDEGGGGDENDDGEDGDEDDDGEADAGPDGDEVEPERPVRDTPDPKAPAAGVDKSRDRIVPDNVKPKYRTPRI